MPNMKQMYEDNARTEPAYPVVWLPVGTIYENRFDITEEINKYFVGVWERYGNGCVTVGVNEGDSDFGTANKVLGEKKHTLTSSEMPAHSHNLSINAVNNKASITGKMGTYPILLSADNAPNWSSVSNISILSSGSTQSHNNIQPSITVYRWVRIS